MEDNKNKKDTVTDVNKKKTTVNKKTTNIQKPKNEVNYKEKYENISEKMAHMEGMILAMQNMKDNTSEKSMPELSLNERVPIKSYFLRRVYIPVSKTNAKLLPRYNSLVYFTAKEVDDMMANMNVRENFECGLLGFDDDKYYEIFGISNDFELTRDNIIKILELPDEEMISRLNYLTDDMKKDSVVWNLIYQIAWLVSNNKIPNVPASKIKYLDEVFFGALPENWHMSLTQAQINLAGMGIKE